VSNRQGDQSTLAIFAIDPGTGRVSLCRHEPTRGRTPRNFALNADGTVLIVGNRESDNAAVFRVTDAGGTLVHLGTHAVAPGPFFIGIY
jgi:6-phosphogluconolactonase